MVTHGDVITLDEKELAEVINLECKKRLNMTLEEFVQKRKSGELPKSPATQEIEMLIKLGYKKR